MPLVTPPTKCSKLARSMGTCPGIYATKSAARRCRNDTKLLQHAELIPAGPIFDPLSALIKTRDDHDSNVHVLPGRGDTEQCSGMRAPQREPTGDALAVRYHFLNRTRVT